MIEKVTITQKPTNQDNPIKENNSIPSQPPIGSELFNVCLFEAKQVKVCSMFEFCLMLAKWCSSHHLPMHVRKNSVMMHMSNILFQLDQHYPAAVGTFITQAAARNTRRDLEFIFKNNLSKFSMSFNLEMVLHGGPLKWSENQLQWLPYLQDETSQAGSKPHWT